MKKTSKHFADTASVIDAFDQAFSSQENILVIAALMESTASETPFSNHDHRILAGAGKIITAEARKLNEAMCVLEKHFKPSR